MNFKFLLSFLLLLFLNLEIGLSANSNYFIKIKKSTIEIGDYSKRMKRNTILRFDRNEVDVDSVAKMILVDSTEKILFYFHAMWGGGSASHGHSLKKLNQINGLTKIVSIIWTPDELGYVGSWNRAFTQGEDIRNLLDALTRKTSNEHFALCHSMGHRVFEGIIAGLDTSTKRFEAVFLAASDLDIDVFENNLSGLQQLCARTVLYVSNEDRLLKISKLLHQRDRLGLDARRYYAKLTATRNLEIVDVSHSKGRQKLSLSKHLYFKTNKGVLKDMEHIINNEEAHRALAFTLEEEAVFELD